MDIAFFILDRMTRDISVYFEISENNGTASECR
jgi:hypothetical protein